MGEQIGPVTIEGLKELGPKLDTLETKIATKIIRQVLRAGAKVTFAAAKSTVPVQTGALRSALRVRAGRMRRGYASVGVQVGKQWFTGDQFYGAFVEFGHRLGSRKHGTSRAKVPGEHFMFYAFEESKFQAVELMGRTAITLIEQAAKEAGSGDKK